MPARRARTPDAPVGARRRWRYSNSAGAPRGPAGKCCRECRRAIPRGGVGRLRRGGRARAGLGGGARCAGGDAARAPRRPHVAERGAVAAMRANDPETALRLVRLARGPLERARAGTARSRARGFGATRARRGGGAHARRRRTGELGAPDARLPAYDCLGLGALRGCRARRAPRSPRHRLMPRMPSPAGSPCSTATWCSAAHAAQGDVSAPTGRLGAGAALAHASRRSTQAGAPSSRLARGDS
jgi:hypothetical protein